MGRGSKAPCGGQGREPLGRGSKAALRGGQGGGRVKRTLKKAEIAKLGPTD